MIFNRRKKVLFDKKEIEIVVAGLEEYRYEAVDDLKQLRVIDGLLDLLTGCTRDEIHIKLKQYNLGVVINALTRLWYKMQERNQNTDELDMLTLRLCAVLDQY